MKLISRLFFLAVIAQPAFAHDAGTHTGGIMPTASSSDPFEGK